MAARGAYAKGVAKREEILTTALEVIAKNGYHKTSIRDLAAAVGLSQTGLLHYFGTKEELFVAILQKRDSTDEQRMSVDPAEYAPAQLIEGLVSVGRHNATVPGLVQLYAQFSTEAARRVTPRGSTSRIATPVTGAWSPRRSGRCRRRGRCRHPSIRSAPPPSWRPRRTACRPSGCSTPRST